MKKLGGMILIFIFVGCINSGELRKFPPKDYPRLTQESFSQEEIVTLEHITIRYIPHYEANSRKVRISGSITLNREKIPPGSIISDFALNFFGLDKEYAVISSQRFTRMSVPIDMDAFPFEINLPYTTMVEFIGFKYNCKQLYELT